MIVVSHVRCSDCLTEFASRPRFAVVKRDDSQTYTDEERQLGAHLYEVLVCAECAGWYQDAIQLPDPPVAEGSR